MERKPEILAGQAADSPLHPVYLIAGAETLLVQEAADAVRAQARAQGIGEREVFETDGRDFDWDTLAAAFNSPSLFSPRRLIEVRLPSGKPGKAGAQTIMEFCANPPPDVILLITADQWSKAHQAKWFDAVNQLGVCSIAWPIKPHELTGWLGNRLRTRGVRADADAVRILADRVEGNLLAAAQEVDKLVLLADGESLDAAKMESLVANAARYDVFRLAEAALSGQAQHVSRMIAGLRSEGDVVAGLMPMLVKDLLRTAALARVQANGGNVGAEMKSQGIWEAKQAPYKRAIQRHGEPACWERFVAQASRVDRMAKGRAAGDAWVAMERLLLAVAEPRALRLLSA